jgi:hypothetical protein
MTQEEFNNSVEETLEKVKQLLLNKSVEYQRNSDVFHNFHEGSKRSGMSREKVLDGFLLKHEISISDMTNDLDKGIVPTKEKVDEKFLDNIIYLLIKKAMFIDRINQLQFMKETTLNPTYQNSQELSDRINKSEKFSLSPNDVIEGFTYP